VKGQDPGDFDATLSDANVDDQPAEEPGASPSRGTKVGTKRRARPKARQPVVSASPRSPRRARARSPLQPIDSPETAPGAPRSISGEREAPVAPAIAALESVTESQVVDEFKANSDDEGDMHEVETDLQIGAVSRGCSRTIPGYYSSLLICSARKP
jgi:hypothetical protein